MGSGRIKCIRTSKFPALRNSVRFEVPCVSKFRALRSSVRFEVPCTSKFRVRTILSMILIPIIDSLKHNSDVDNRLFECKSKKNLLKELLNYKSSTYKELTEEEILHLYNKITNKLSIINNV